MHKGPPKSELRWPTLPECGPRSTPHGICRACLRGRGRAGAPAPARLIEGGLPTEATAAQVLACEYADHLPLYRETQVYSRQGMNLDHSTLADWSAAPPGICVRCKSGCLTD